MQQCANNNFNFSGMTFPDIINNISTKISGYWIWINNFIEFDRSATDQNTFTQLGKINPGNDFYNSFHNFYITRELTGEFNVYIDKKLTFSVNDNTSISSKKFGIESYWGLTRVDNISVFDTVIPIITSNSTTISSTSVTTDFNIYMGLTGLFLVTLILKRKRLKF
jgi:hypothetical protein